MEGLSGRRVPRENLHITLAFVGPVDTRRRQCLEEQASHVPLTPFTLDLSRVGAFEGARVLWVAPEETPQALRALVERLNTALRPCDYGADRRGFRPHMTLYRKAHIVPDRVVWTPVAWPVSGFSLVESVTAPEGARYRVLRRFS